MKNKEHKRVLLCIIILALILRLVYIIKTPYTENQHDLELSYIYTIYETGSLPQSNEGQYYHPPLHQIICAIFIVIESVFITDIETINESFQFVTLTYSMIMLYVIYMISKEIKLKDRHILYVMFVTAFHPTLIILSGSLNNDNLCVLLTMWSILRVIKWYKKSNIKNTILLAIITGLAVMAKTNGAIVSVPIIYIFILKLYKEFKKSKDKKVILKKYILLFGLFGIIALPIGLWYNIRNYILFKQPILYVLDPGNTDLYVGNYNLLQRFFPISKEILQIYCHPYEDYNIPTYLLKCSLFGEFIWKQNIISTVCYVLSMVCNIILTIIGLMCIIKRIIIKDKRKIWVNTLFLLWIVNIISYISMNLKLPYGCSMDFRYIVPTIFVQAIFICFELQNILKYNKKKEGIIFTCIFEITLITFLLANAIIVF